MFLSIRKDLNVSSSQVRNQAFEEDPGSVMMSAMEEVPRILAPRSFRCKKITHNFLQHIFFRKLQLSLQKAFERGFVDTDDVLAATGEQLPSVTSSIPQFFQNFEKKEQSSLTVFMIGTKFLTFIRLFISSFYCGKLSAVKKSFLKTSM